MTRDNTVRLRRAETLDGILFLLPHRAVVVVLLRMVRYARALLEPIVSMIMLEGGVHIGVLFAAVLMSELGLTLSPSSIGWTLGAVLASILVVFVVILTLGFVGYLGLRCLKRLDSRLQRIRPTVHIQAHQVLVGGQRILFADIARVEMRDDTIVLVMRRGGRQRLARLADPRDRQVLLDDLSAATCRREGGGPTDVPPEVRTLQCRTGKADAQS